MSVDATQRSTMQKGVRLVVGLLVIALLTAFLLPIALDELNAVDVSAWTAAEQALFGLLGIFFILGVVIFVVNWAMDG